MSAKEHPDMAREYNDWVTSVAPVSLSSHSQVMRIFVGLVGVMTCLVVAVACSADDSPRVDSLPSEVVSDVAMPNGPLPLRIVSLATRCPSPEVGPQFPPGGRLPTGATQVRICNYTGDRMMGMKGHPELDFRVPVDALTTNVDRVVNMVNTAAAKPPDDPEGRTFCGGVGAPTQVLWFSYPETDFAVTYNLGTCEDLQVGATAVEGGKSVAATLSDLLWDQRNGLRPPEVRLRARCSPNVVEETPLVLADQLDLVDAVLCDYPGGVRQARLTPAALDAINADYTAVEGYQEQGCPPLMLRGITAWGDRFTWWGSCWDFPIQNTFGADLHWQASPEVRAILEDLRFGPTRKQDTSHPGL
ncbi:MAG: hypothetical protein LH624_05295 [Cryobacterium sp.]|nr:hypothetical protein [Cryobacterium sp.]